jgi:tRNA(Arg) A34 adenosine deaminase TadA
MNEHDLQYMQRAIALSRENLQTGDGGPFGAVIVHNGEIIAEGRNLVVAGNDPTAHAEVVAIREACRRLGRFHLEDCDIYASCEPCPMCLGAIYWARLRRLFFAADREDAASAGFDDSMIYQEIPLPSAERSIPTERIMKDDAAEVFREWKQKEGRVRY